MEDAARAGSVWQLGIAHVPLSTLPRIYKEATIKPATVYIRGPFWKAPQIVREVRSWNDDIKIQQAGMFARKSSKRAARTMIEDDVILLIAKKLRKSPIAVFYRFILGLGVVPLISSGKRKGWTVEQYFVAQEMDRLSYQDALAINQLMQQVTRRAREEGWFDKDVKRGGVHVDEDEDEGDEDEEETGGVGDEGLLEGKAHDEERIDKATISTTTAFLRWTRRNPRTPHRNKYAHVNYVKGINDKYAQQHQPMMAEKKRT